MRNLLARDLAVRYKSSVLGFVWTLLNPLLQMLVLTVVFQVLLPTPIPYFPLFILTGILAWNFCTAALSGATQSIVGNVDLVRKVYFPRDMLTLSTVLASLVHFILALGLVFLFLPFVGEHGLTLAGTDLSITWLVLWLPIIVVFQALFLAGLGLFLAAINVFFRDTQAIMDVALMAWFFLTPVIYPLQTLYDRELGPVNLGWLMHVLNPMASFITTYRLLLIERSAPDPAFLARTFATSVLVLLAGYAFFKWLEPRFGEEL